MDLCLYRALDADPKLPRPYPGWQRRPFNSAPDLERTDYAALHRELPGWKRYANEVRELYRHVTDPDNFRLLPKNKPTKVPFPDMKTINDLSPNTIYVLSGKVYLSGTETTEGEETTGGIAQRWPQSVKQCMIGLYNAWKPMTTLNNNW